MRRLARTRWIPKDSLPIEQEGLGVVYVYPIDGREGKVYGAIAYAFKRTKADWHHIYKTDAKLDVAIEEWFNRLRGHLQHVKTMRAEYNKPHNFKVGDIVTNSWGYDQTNVDWYRVTRTTEHYVWLKPVAATLQTDEGAGPMSGYERLALDENLKPIDLDKPEQKHKASGNGVTMKYGVGSKWTGESQYSSWYA